MTSKNTDSLKKGLSDLFYGPDGTIERAWERLHLMWKQCADHMTQSISTIKNAEEQIRRNAELADTWQKRADASAGEGNNELVRQCLDRKEQYQHAADSQRAEYAMARVELAQAWRGFCSAEAIVSEVQVQKILLVALPRLTKEESGLFAAVCADLHQALKPLLQRRLDETASANMTLVVSRLEGLEKCTSEIYKSITDGADAQALAGKTIDRCLEKLSAGVEELAQCSSELKEILVNSQGATTISPEQNEIRKTLREASLQNMSEALQTLANATKYLEQLQESCNT